MLYMMFTRCFIVTCKCCYPKLPFISSFAVYESTGDISRLLSCEGVGNGIEKGGGRLVWDRGLSTMSQTGYRLM